MAEISWLVNYIIAFASVAFHVSIVNLFWEVYMPWLPNYSIERGILHRMQFGAAQKFILERSRTPSTAKFCSFSETIFGEDRRTGHPGMAGWVDMQNQFGAMMRESFVVVYSADTPRIVDAVRWADEGDLEWKRTVK